MNERGTGAQRRLGLRVDVDTHDGMRDGVPRLLDLLKATGARATFYFAFGPDRSGRAILNLLQPGFLAKMLRTRAPSVYGLRTLLSGTLLPARLIGLAFPDIARRARAEGHETGVHAWDHRGWQDRVLRFSLDRIIAELDCGRDGYREVFGAEPTTYAAPAWLTCGEALQHQETYELAYASDCRGSGPFLPVAGGRALKTPQVPTTLPTLDEALGDTHAGAGAFYTDLLGWVRPGEHPVFTLHAEMEGGAFADDFAGFLADARFAGVRLVPLGELLADRRARGPLPICELRHAPVRGRHGVLSTQSER